MICSNVYLLSCPGSLYITCVLYIRVKMMNGDAPHNQVDADMAAGMGAPDHGPRLRTEGVAMAL
jgi:hypothetical protein